MHSGTVVVSTDGQLVFLVGALGVQHNSEESCSCLYEIFMRFTAIFILLGRSEAGIVCRNH
jgi:hypothetical protein